MDLTTIIIDDYPEAIEDALYMVENTPGLVCLKTFESAIEAIKFLSESGGVDIIFSDIDMPDINGIEAGKILSNYCSFLIYITAHRNFTREAFDVWAFGYLLKPMTIGRFQREIMAVFSKKEKIIKLEHNENVLIVKGDKRDSYHNIDISRIRSISSLANYVTIHTLDKDIVTYMTLKKILDQLRYKNLFFRISKTRIISFDFVDRIVGNMVVMSNLEKYDIGTGYRNDLRDYVRRRT